ncbi:osmoprotectant transport system permease protein [Pseudonocardia sediminis]|uniref:Osmoprotectant transport system permease protein n=1 Tax=Pseudonocardia sediminis TaxID=1397368 RepID=A0A4V2FRD0_PSEST|nr:ABC transporter permease [Pseudonocardia sediminis]RZT88130.1 osmoprotectant transport system permease protein [Pseudonocardia sediminis]
MDWVFRNSSLVLELTGQHIVFSLVPVLIGLVLAVPLGWLANRTRIGRSLTLNIAGFLYTLPSLALFVFLPPIIGTRILDPLNVIVALSVYVLALLVRTVADALNSIPSTVVNSATAMGYRPGRRFLTVELPLAVPVILAGLRVAAVSSISLVTVGSVIGFGGLGKMFTEGFQREIPQETISGIVLVLLLAIVVDGLLLLAGRALTPWDRPARTRRTAGTAS